MDPDRAGDRREIESDQVRSPPLFDRPENVLRSSAAVSGYLDALQGEERPAEEPGETRDRPGEQNDAEEDADRATLFPPPRRDCSASKKRLLLAGADRDEPGLAPTSRHRRPSSCPRPRDSPPPGGRRPRPPSSGGGHRASRAAPVVPELVSCQQHRSDSGGPPRARRGR